ncbi:hypothetical protein GIB67_034686 [Kingdonia uniflora]|uniref:DUF7815 domain-containing protein n=1 Tax=Kingdonia uniflora TaxID=39325 RepID=A0A7J7P0W5_9MAGN|nr:hypothetical protein GIB67_034686 [Kingdonia uniflora]
MAFEIPTSLIHQIQTQLRQEAGIPSYDPNNLSILDLPSLHEALEQLDPSPPYLRCKHCKAKLLRGFQSMICIYCGVFREMDPPPDPIPFKSTFGYRCFLKSLHVDEQSAVKQFIKVYQHLLNKRLNMQKLLFQGSVGASDSGKGQNAANNDLIFSDPFDLELKWSALSEKTETSNASSMPVYSKSFLNLAGVDLDNFFSETQKDAAPSTAEEQFMPRKQISSVENSAFKGQESLNLFENAQSSELAVSAFSGQESINLFENAQPSKLVVSAFSGQESCSLFENSQSSEMVVLARSVTAEVAIGDHFSSWEAEIRPATSEALPSESNSFDLFAGSSFESKVNNNGESNDKLNSLSSMNSSGIDNFVWATGRDKLSHSDNVNENDYKFDAWQEFSSSGNTTDPLSSSGNTAVEQCMPYEETSETNTPGVTKDLQEVEIHSCTIPDIFPGANTFLEADRLQNSLTYVDGIKDTSISNREGVNIGVDTQNTGNGLENLELTMQPECTDSIVESLMSQMHDLSFMLESNLSISKKEDEFDPITWC